MGRGNIFRNDDKENSPDFNTNRARVSQRVSHNSLSFSLNSQGQQGRSQGGKGVQGADPHVPSGAQEGGQKEKERSDRSRDAAAQW